MALQNDRKSIEELGSSLTIKVPYSADLNFPLDKALELAKTALPRTREIISGLNAVKSARDLENLLKETNTTLIVEKNFAEDFQKFLNTEEKVSKEVEMDLKEFCPLPLPSFSKEEIDKIVNAGICEIAIEPPAPILNLDQLKDELKSDEPLNQKNDLEKCLAEIDQITENIKHLIEEEKKAGNISFELEESEWFYIIASEYYRERHKVVKRYLGIFEPLLLERRRLENELKVAPNLLHHFEIGISTGNTYDKTDDPVPNDITHFLIGQEKHPIRVQLEKDLEVAKDEIKKEKDKVSEFDTSLGEEELKTKLQDLFGNNNIGFSIQNKVRGFADENRISVGFPFPSASNVNFSIGFTLIIGSPLFESYVNGSIKLDETLFEKVDVGVSKGEFRKNITDMFNSERISFSRKDPNLVVHGVLYDQLYNIMGNPNLFFTDAERGSSSQSPPTILNETIFEGFWTNFEARWKERKQLKIDTIIKPAHNNILEELRNLARIEAIWLLTFGRVFEDLLDEDDADRLRSVVSTVEHVFQTVDKNRTANKRAIDIINIYRQRIKEETEIQKSKYGEVECAKNPGGPPVNIPAPGNDPLGKKTYKEGNNPQLPDPTKYCYWKEFAKLATIINVLPIPSNKPVPPNIFRYWPVGLIIPSPAGPFNVPLPIVWKALATIPTPMGIFVIFLGQCGILPCPFVLWISDDGESKFIATLRGKKNIVSATGVASNTLPPIKITTGSLKLNIQIVNQDKDGKSLIDSIFGYEAIEDPDSPASIIKDVFDRINKKVSKLENPDFSKIAKMREREAKIEKAIKNGLSIPQDFSLQEKISAVEDSIKKLFDKLEFDDICFPKNTEKLNPKLTLVEKVIDTLEKAKDLKLPELAIPEIKQIDLKEKLLGQLEGDPLVNEEINLDGLSVEEKNKKIGEIQGKMESVISKATEKMKKPEVLGVIGAVAKGVKVNFFNPFVCGPSGDGAKIPPIPGPVFAGIAFLAASIPPALRLLEEKDINGKSIKEVLISTIDKIVPTLKVPDPSNLSIKDFAINTSSKLALFSKPPIPNPGPIVRKICIPGGLIKSALKAAILAAITSGIIEKILLGGKIDVGGISVPSSVGVPPKAGKEGITTSLTKDDIIKIIEKACEEAIPEEESLSSDGSTSSTAATGISFGATGISSPPISTVSKKLKMRYLNPSDIRQLLTVLVEGSLKEVERKIKPILQAIALLNALPELNFFKLPNFELNKGLTLVFEKKKIDIAFDQLAKLSTVPFFAVATGAEISRALHPLANTDDLPPWERLSLKNILFVVYLDQFCSAARSGGGFQENTLFPSPG